MQDLSHIQIGDTLAIRNRAGGWSSQRLISHDLFTVVGSTATQLKLQHTINVRIGHRVRIKDGKVIGTAHTHAIEATQEIIELHNHEVALARRDRAAQKSLYDLDGRYLRQLGLTLEQKEALAEAWTRIKAMGQESQG